MNSNWKSIFYIFIIIAINTIRCDLYEPLIYFGDSDVHHFTFEKVEYDDSLKHYVVKTATKNQEIFVACPTKDPNHPDTFEIQSTELGKAAVIPICERPAESQIYFAKFSSWYNVVGFLVHTPDKLWPVEFIDVSKHHMVIELIHFKFDKCDKRITSLWYFIIGGKFLKPELTRRSDELWKYRKNEDIYEKDIDTFYSQAECPFVKVPLAPEEDFLFNYWKIASRQNIFTAPMWRNLQPQWQALEIFIRKVTQIIDHITVETGIYEELSKLSDGLRNNLFGKIHWPDEQYRIPRYFWKMITLQQESQGRQFNYGILFIMHNVPDLYPDNEWNIKEICSDYDFVNLGWKFLQDDHFTSPMYGCPIDDVTTNRLRQINNENFEDFDLNLLSLLKYDDEGNEYIEEVKVIQEMEKLKATVDRTD